MYNTRGYLFDLLIDAVWLWLFIVFAFSGAIVGWVVFFLRVLVAFWRCFWCSCSYVFVWWKSSECADDAIGSMEAILRRRKAKRKKRRKKRERNGKSERKKRGGWGSRIGFGESWCIHGLFLTHSGRCLENEASHILTWVKLDWWLDTWFSCSPLGGNDLSWGALSSMFSDGLKQPRTTLPNISQLGKRKIIFKTILGGDMLVVKRERIYCWPIEKNLIDFPSWTFQSWKIWGFAWLILSFWVGNLRCRWGGSKLDSSNTEPVADLYTPGRLRWHWKKPTIRRCIISYQKWWLSIVMFFFGGCKLFGITTYLGGKIKV